MSKRTTSGRSDRIASLRVALQFENITPGLETTSNLMRSTTGLEMRPSFFATYIIAFLSENDRRTKWPRPALVSSFLEFSSEFIFAGIPAFNNSEADIRPESWMEGRFSESVKWHKQRTPLFRSVTMLGVVGLGVKLRGILDETRSSLWGQIVFLRETFHKRFHLRG